MEIAKRQTTREAFVQNSARAAHPKCKFFNLSFFCFECYDFPMHKKDEERTAAQIAKTLTMMCVRNTFLEELHEGITPVSKTGDYSDVKVIDGEGREIAWAELSRISDDEMKTLMKEIVNRVYTFFMRAENPKFQASVERWRRAASRWDEPEPELDEVFGLTE